MDETLVKYGNKTFIRSLMQLVPFGIGSVIDVGIQAKIDTINSEKTKIFFDELQAGNVTLDESLINSHEFIHCFVSTTRAVMQTHQSEKIKRLARLLKSSFTDKSPRNIDEYDELRGIIEEISFTEWQALIILDEYTNSAKVEGKNTLQWSSNFWGEYTNKLHSVLEIPTNEITPFLNRISRTGLYEQIVGGFMDYTGGVGYLTPRFYRLKEFIES